MFKRDVTSTILVATAALTVMSGAAFAESGDDSRYANELNACVTAMKANIEMDGVRRIRHVVTKLAPDVLGYKMTLQTVTYADKAVRQYEASCSANGDNPPFRLHIRESTA
jgi:hypothetical protein